MQHTLESCVVFVIGYQINRLDTGFTLPFNVASSLFLEKKEKEEEEKL